MSITQNFIKKLKGETRFVTDIVPSSYICGKIIHSDIPSGKIVSIYVPDLPENYICLRAKDIPGKNRILLWGAEMPLLAEGRVNYQGEPILLLGGPDMKTLDLIASKIKIEYLEDEAVMEPEELCYNSLSDNVQQRTGDVEQAFNDATLIVDGEYRTCLQFPAYVEDDCAVAIWNEYQNIIYTSTNSPFLLQDNLVQILNVPKKKIRVIVPASTSPLGGRVIVPFLLSCYAILIASVSRRAVRMTYAGRSVGGLNIRRYPFRIRYTSALDEKGLITGNKVDIQVDTGYYRLFASQIVHMLLTLAVKLYACSNNFVSITLNRTNKAPLGGFNGIGEAELAFARELHINKISGLLHKDPLFWRRKNIAAVRKTIRGKNESGDIKLRVLADVISRSDFNRKYGAYEALTKKRKSIIGSQGPIRGVGLSLFPHIILSHMGVPDARYALKVTLGRDDKVRIKSSAIDMGDSKTAFFAALASEILDTHISEVYMDQVDTYKVPDSGPSMISKTVIILRRLVELACSSLKRRRRKEPLPIEVKKIFSVDKNPVELGICWEATVVEVEVDPFTFEVICRGIWISMDAGKIINHDKAYAHVELSAVQNFESATIDVNPFDFDFNYNIPCSLDVPPMDIRFLEREDAQPISLGIQPVCGVAPALISAVSQACHHDFTYHPVTPDIIQKILEGK